MNQQDKRRMGRRGVKGDAETRRHGDAAMGEIIQPPSSLNFFRVSASPRLRVSASVFLCCLLLSLCAQAQTVEFLGRQVTGVTIEIEGAPGSTVTEMRSLIDVASGQDYSPGRIHDSLVRLFRSGLIANARVEATADGA